MQRRVLHSMLWPFRAIALEVSWLRASLEGRNNKPFLLFPTLVSKFVALLGGAFVVWFTGRFYVLLYEAGTISYNLATQPLAGRIGTAFFWWLIGAGVKFFEDDIADLDFFNVQLLLLILLGAMVGTLIPL